MQKANEGMIGVQFGRLTVISRYENLFFLCRCICGTTKLIKGNKLRSGHTKSCGCLRKDVVAKRNRNAAIHGMTNTRVFGIWIEMKKRCNNSRHRAYKDYGGRGITVCERWRIFENFYADMGDPPSSNHTLDRKENNGPYSKENCRWATWTEQANNKRTNKILEYMGEKFTLAEVSRLCGIYPERISHRIKSGWTIKEAVETPVSPRRKATSKEKEVTKL